MMIGLESKKQVGNKKKRILKFVFRTTAIFLTTHLKIVDRHEEVVQTLRRDS